jgi:hypothetical protein
MKNTVALLGKLKGKEYDLEATGGRIKQICILGKFLKTQVYMFRDPRRKDNTCVKSGKSTGGSIWVYFSRETIVGRTIQVYMLGN